MTSLTEEQYQAKIRELEKEVKKLNLIIQKDSKIKYGLRWIDVPEAFEEDSENKIPILEEAKENAIKNDDAGPTHILIEGDNYHALKCLNYTHKGKIDVIYIDPPYNTGSDGFTYKDKRFLSQFPDGTTIPKEHPLRHSTWLSFMSKRLELAKNLLSEKGVIFISIDNNEMGQLKILCDDIFGENNFIGSIDWESKTKSQNTESAYQKLQPKCEYIFCYGSEGTKHKFNLIAVGQKDYKFSDEKGIYREHYLEVMNANGIRGRETMVFDISDGVSTVSLPNGKQWQLGQDQVATFKKRNDLFIRDGKVVIKMRPDDERTEKTEPFWAFFDKSIGTAESAKKELNSIVGDNHGFDTVKPTEMVQRLLFHSTGKSSIILDFFAGSGTTLHATIKLNSQDGGKRQCILVQQKEKDNNICRNITYERNRRVMQGYTNSKGEAVSGLGNSLKYYRTAFVGENEAEYATDKDKIALSKKAGSLLSMAENTLEEYVSTDRYQIFGDDKNLFTGIYFSANADKIDEFSAKLEQLRNLSPLNMISAYFFSSSDGSEFSDEFKSLKNIKIKSIPEPILEVYRRLN